MGVSGPPAVGSAETAGTGGNFKSNDFHRDVSNTRNRNVSANRNVNANANRNVNASGTGM